MSILLDDRRRLRIAGLAALAAAGMLLAAPAAQAATTSISRDLATMTGMITLDSANDTVTIVNAGGNLSHGLKTSGSCPTCNSDIDWDTSALALGDQTLAASPATQIEVNGGDGDDSITAPLGLLPPSSPEILKAVLNGGNGNDHLTGSRAADDLRGGTGDDRLAGFVGNDDMEGGTGDDTLVWSNGDNNDVIDGDDGRDVVEVNGSPTAGDVFTVGPGAVAGRIRLDRTNLVPFNLDIGTSEALALNGLGGDDSVTAGEVGAFAIVADGGSGNDSLNGGPGAETFLGGTGNDTISPGAGIDFVSGAEGDDVIDVRDGGVDFTRCGDGTDQVTADAAALDAGMEGCETISRPPISPVAPVPTVPVATIPATRPVTISASPVKIKKRRGKIGFACPATSPGSCRVNLNLLAGAKAGQLNVVVVLARASFELQRGEARGVRIKVPAGADGLANRNGRLSVLAVTSTTGPSGASASRTQRITLDFGKPKQTRGSSR